MRYIVGYNNIHIVDSYTVTSGDAMLDVLNEIRCDYGTNWLVTELFKRSNESMIREWKSHNLLYNLHLFRSHTKDVDIDLEPWYRRMIYYILSLFY